MTRSCSTSPGRATRSRPRRSSGICPSRCHPRRRCRTCWSSVYRTDPTCAQVCERLVDIDEGVQEWRYRHVKMVERTIGSKPGTGGSEGVGYLDDDDRPPGVPRPVGDPIAAVSARGVRAAPGGSTLGEAYPPGAAGYAVRATLPDGTPAVLKLIHPHREAEHEADALAHWDGDGAVRLLDRDDARNAILIERCEPGTPLSAAGPEAALDVLIGLLPRLWKPAGAAVPHARRRGGVVGRLPARRVGGSGRPFERRLLDAAIDALEGARADAGRAGAAAPGSARRQRACGAARAVARDRPQAARRRARVRGRADRALDRARPQPAGGAAPARPADVGARPRPRPRPRLDDRADHRVGGGRRPGRRAPRDRPLAAGGGIRTAWTGCIADARSTAGRVPLRRARLLEIATTTRHWRGARARASGRWVAVDER